MRNLASRRPPPPDPAEPAPPVREPPHFWYAPRSAFGALLAPIGWLVALFTVLRRAAYRAGMRRSRRIGCPVVVVGNLSVGGTGKTPLVIALARLLAQRGLRVGVICRGYRGIASRWPRKVRPDSDPKRVGDEAVLLARRTGGPVAAGPNRIAAGRILFRRSKCDVILSDDGLQHLRLARAVGRHLHRDEGRVVHLDRQLLGRRHQIMHAVGVAPEDGREQPHHASPRDRPAFVVPSAVAADSHLDFATIVGIP